LAADARYVLAGFIFQDPLYRDYSVCLGNKNREGARKPKTWVVANKRQLYKTNEPRIDITSSPLNAQVLLYKWVPKKRFDELVQSGAAQLAD